MPVDTPLFRPLTVVELPAHDVDEKVKAYSLDGKPVSPMMPPGPRLLVEEPDSITFARRVTNIGTGANFISQVGVAALISGPFAPVTAGVAVGAGISNITIKAVSDYTVQKALFDRVFEVAKDKKQI